MAPRGATVPRAGCTLGASALVVFQIHNHPSQAARVGLVSKGPVTAFLCLLLGAFTRGASPQQAFRVEPDNITVLEGAVAVLQCVVENPTGVVQWVKGGLLLGPDRSIPGFPRYSMTGDLSKGEHHLQIVGSRLADDADYECQVGRSEESPGIVSRTALLGVLVPPKLPVFKEYEANSTVTWVAGVEYRVTCSAGDAKPAAAISFSKDGSPLPDVSSRVHSGSSEKLSTTEAVLRITPQSLENGKRLLCAATNEAVSAPVVAGFTMNILFPPQPPTIEGYKRPEIKAGETLKLTCISLSGNPLATLQWLKNGEVISTSWETDDTSRASRSLLTLSIKPEDNLAQLRCEAGNQVSPLPLPASITLRVVFLPTEVSILGSSSTPENKQISLSCSTAPSNPPVQLRWWLGWRELTTTEVTVTEAAHGGTVTVSNLTHVARREENGLPLTCEAFNEAVLFTRSASLPLSVQYPPQKIWIEAPPLDSRFRAGTKVRLTCFASGGHPAPRLIWIKDTKSLKEGTQVVSGKIVSKELILTTSPSDNLATYRCNASNDGKSPALTAHTRLRIQFPPLDVKITTTAKEVRRGQTLTLTCVTGSSNPFATLTWLKDAEKLKGVDLGRKPAEFGGLSTSGKVTLVATSSDNGRRVTCQAYSSVLAETVNTFYKLNVLYPPEFSAEQPAVAQAVEHGAVELPLRVSANPPEMTCSWSFRGETLIPEGSPRHHLRAGPSLAIWNVSRADAGQYRARCQNPEGQNETHIQLHVHYAPSIRSLGDPVYVDLGAAAEFVCVADANPTPAGMFQWTWLGVEERSLEELGLEPEASGAVGRLRIREAQRAQAGLYECRVDNGLPPPARGSARLIVRFKPEIEKGVGLGKVAVPGDGSSPAALQCRAQGVPSVQFSWAKNGAPLHADNPRYTERTWHEGTWHSSTLTIANVSAAQDYATFTCRASNALGTDRLDIQLLSTSRPDPPTGLKVVSVTHNSAALEWIPGFDGGLPQRFRIRYRWPGTPSTLYVDVFPPQTPAFTLTGLSPATPYSVGVSAHNPLGESDQGPSVTVTTAELHVEEPPIPEPEVPETEAPALPPALVGGLSALGALLLLSNAALFTCLLRQHQASARPGVPEEAAGMRKPSAGNEYSPGEAVNPAARHTLLDSYSERSVSSEGSFVGTWPGYVPGRGYQPRLPPHPERAERETDANSTDFGVPAPWLSPSDPHEYEDVMEPGVYEELGALRPQAPAPFRQGMLPCQDYMGAYPWRGWSLAGSEDPLRIYDRVAATPPPGADEELPFELRGELV
ncbi:nephrin [Emydura macquarii macquarii]|uniref:nephrin n=1 Tax=Emydura macquarii macquarii TaxID=1129001 RepID=UPI003529EC37